MIEYSKRRTGFGAVTAVSAAVVLTMAGVLSCTNFVNFPQSASPGGALLPMAKSRPVVCEIPALGVSVGTLVELGTTPAGRMEVPSGVLGIGWYGAVPGEPGVAIIAGHFAFGFLRGAFSRLGDLRPGDIITVLREDGHTAVFVTARVDRHAAKTDPGLLATHSGVPQLRLTTAPGDYDDSGMEPERVVVSADLVHTA